MTERLLGVPYTSNNPFGVATDLVMATLPSLNGTLEMTVFLKWIPHDAAGLDQQSKFWDAWTTAQPTARQKRNRERMRNRVRGAIEWAEAMTAWAAVEGYGERFFVTLVPVLEDTCSSGQRRGFRRFVDMITRIENEHAVSIHVRRSYCIGCSRGNLFRVYNLPLELHGRLPAVLGHLRSGDSWSNDGTDYTRADFLRDQSVARDLGINVLAWRQVYNGNEPRGRDDWAQRTINPFSTLMQRRYVRRVFDN